MLQRLASQVAMLVSFRKALSSDRRTRRVLGCPPRKCCPFAQALSFS